VVAELDDTLQRALLQFWSGSDGMPAEGFGSLEPAFHIVAVDRLYDKADKTARLPAAHTCFRQLDLPRYRSLEELREKIITAITVGQVGRAGGWWWGGCLQKGKGLGGWKGAGGAGGGVDCMCAVGPAATEAAEGRRSHRTNVLRLLCRAGLHGSVMSCVWDGRALCCWCEAPPRPSRGRGARPATARPARRWR
jgi:hypothetical protein